MLMTTIDTPPVQVPLPNDRYDGSLVIASIWLRDDEDVVLGMLLLLNPSTPYYRVVDVVWDGEEWVRQHGTQEAFENINPAVEHFANNGGDY